MHSHRTKGASYTKIRCPMPPFSLEKEPYNEHTQVIGVHGELDIFTAPQLKQALQEALDADSQHIVLDLSKTTFLDSTTLGVLVGAVRKIQHRDGKITLVSVDADISKLFHITRLDQLFPIVSSREEAFHE